VLSLLPALFVPVVSSCGASSSGGTEKTDEPDEEPKPEAEAIALLDKLAGAMRNDRADRMVDVADPVHGLTFWGQPGACATPLFRVDTEESGRLTQLARKRVGPAPPHYFDPKGYWSEVAQTIRAGLRVVKVNAGDYEVPPEEGIERAPAWASLDTRKVAPGKAELQCLDDEDKKRVRRAKRSEYRYRFRAERGYSSVTVFLVEHEGALRVAHVIQVWHYDA
jgi:hypothetical protein